MGETFVMDADYLPFHPNPGSRPSLRHLAPSMPIVTSLGPVRTFPIIRPENILRVTPEKISYFDCGII